MKDVIFTFYKKLGTILLGQFNKLSIKQPREPLMKEKCRYASVSGVMALLVALGTGVEAKTNTVAVYFVRATKYHKKDTNCDSWTLNGQTSTQLRLPQSDTVVTNPNNIGNVALDPNKVPEGSLVYETQTGRFFVLQQVELQL